MEDTTAQYWGRVTGKSVSGFTTLSENWNSVSLISEDLKPNGISPGGGRERQKPELQRSLNGTGPEQVADSSDSSLCRKQLSNQGRDPYSRLGAYATNGIDNRHE